jgi:hypothetical protein
MATDEEAIALLIENWQTPDFTSARNAFGDNAAILRGKDRLRTMEYDLDLARSQGAAIDAMRRKLVQTLLTYQTTLQEALTASAPPLVVAQIETAISAASSLITEVDTPVRFEAITPSFTDCLPEDA